MANTSEKVLNGAGLAEVWTQAKAKFASSEHTHTPAGIGAAPAPIISQTDITAGTMPAVGQSYHFCE